MASGKEQAINNAEEAALNAPPLVEQVHRPPGQLFFLRRRHSARGRYIKALWLCALTASFADLCPARAVNGFLSRDRPQKEKPSWPALLKGRTAVIKGEFRHRELCRFRLEVELGDGQQYTNTTNEKSHHKSWQLKMEKRRYNNEAQEEYARRG